MNKKLLIMCHHFPQSGILAYESLMMALSSTAFCENVSLLFRKHALWQLIANQTATAAQPHPLSSVLQSMGLYDFETVYALEDERKMIPTNCNFVPNVTWMSHEALPLFVAQHHHTMSI